MKKWFLLALFLAPALATAEPMRSSKEEPVFVKFDASVRVSSTIILIDLSSTTAAGGGGVFPHGNTGSINIFEPRIMLDKSSAASSGTIKLGVLTTVNSATGTVTWFHGMHLIGTTDSQISGGNWAYRTKVDKNGNTPFIVSSTRTVASTTYQNDTGLIGFTANNANPEVGDIILEITNSAPFFGHLGAIIELKYNSEP